jgi:hypothetical protein
MSAGMLTPAVPRGATSRERPWIAVTRRASMAVFRRFRRFRPFRPLARDQRGSATALSLLLGTTFIVLPVMILVLTLPSWEQRVVDAQDAARSAARALVTAGDWDDGISAANQAVSQLVAGDGLPPEDLSVAYTGSLDPGGTVTAAVTVVIPAGNLPGLGFVGELHYTASSTAHVDSYQDSSS